MNTKPAILVRNVSKHYLLYDRPQDRLKQSLFWRFDKNYGRPFLALENVSFEVQQGEVLGIIGRNGAGKSTLLQIIAGTTSPSTGEVQVDGRLGTLLELGSGFNPEFTGRENVYLNGAILGLSRHEMDGLFDEIAAFADIGEFIDQPVKVYSSGMFVRLAFAVQACVDPGVLIVDEILSVGDIFFQQKCHSRMETLLARGTAIVLVSHDTAAIEKYSTRAMVLERGRCLFLGQPNEAVQRYYPLACSLDRKSSLASSANNVEAVTDSVVHELNVIADWPAESSFLDLSKAVVIGEEEVARCSGIALCNEKGEACINFQIGDVACFYYEFQVFDDIEVPLGGIEITNRMNITIHAKNSLQHSVKAPHFVRKGTRIRFRQTIRLMVAADEYTFTVAFATMSAEDHAKATEMDYSLLHSKIHTILRVRQAGRILVTRDRLLPFYGYADLKGDCVLSILK